MSYLKSCWINITLLETHFFVFCNDIKIYSHDTSLLERKYLLELSITVAYWVGEKSYCYGVCYYIEENNWKLIRSQKKKIGWNTCPLHQELTIYSTFYVWLNFQYKILLEIISLILFTDATLLATITSNFNVFLLLVSNVSILLYTLFYSLTYNWTF